MSDTNAPEPTMEEILASIRRIISEDDAPAPAAAQAATSPGEPSPPPASHALHEGSSHGHAEDVLELTDRLEPEPHDAAPPPEPAPAAAPPPPAAKPAAPPPSDAAASLGDLDFTPAASSAPPPPADRAATGGDEPLVGHGAAGRAGDHFGSLASRLSMPAQGRSLEDVVRELLRPLMKEWLDAHLPGIVEARVQDEVERISRRRTY